jgi:hypothetical protein
MKSGCELTTRRHRQFPYTEHCTLLVVLLLLSACPAAHAQVWHASGDLVVGFPQGAFKDRVGRAGIGVSGLIGYQPAQQPFLLGLRLELLNYGSQTWTMPGVNGNTDVNSTNNILLVHALARLQPGEGTFRPYLEGVIGFNWLFTTSSFQHPSTIYGEPNTHTEIEFDDTAFSYGGGGGIMILLSGSQERDEDAVEEVRTEFLVELGMRYVAGARSRYLKAGTIQTSSGGATYAPLESDTDLLMAQVGLSYRF